MNLKSLFKNLYSKLEKNIAIFEKWHERVIITVFVLLLINLFVESTIFGDIATWLLILVTIPKIITVIIKYRTKKETTKEQK